MTLGLRQNSLWRSVAALGVLLIGLLAASGGAQTGANLPTRLSDDEFWTLVTDFSEPSGMFGSDNWVSNERSYQTVLDELARGRQPASVYIGVGPEQNFTYLLALKPRVAFIVDIRRQNLVLHLMYKALFELSSDRADFLSRLFARARPSGLEKDASIEQLFDAFNRVDLDLDRLYRGVLAVRQNLLGVHALKLTRADELDLERALSAFAFGGPDLTYAGPRRMPGPTIYPTFEEVMRETDAAGVHRNFLAGEANFQAVQALQRNNLIIPIVGDFAGPKALKAVGRYIRAHSATVTSFYTSNVEQYLFQTTAWPAFYDNVSTLPVTGNSVFIRGLIKSGSGQYSASPALPPTSHYETVLFPIADLVARHARGGIRSYYDVIGQTGQSSVDTLPNRVLIR